jgi:hypothetical protein
MNQLGNLFGILTAVFFGLATLTFFVKLINRKCVMKLPKENKFKQGYSSVMKFLVKNHRFFGLGAAVLMVAHVVLQILFKWVSVTGIITASIAFVTGMLGWIMFKAKKRTPAMLWAHRGSVVALAIAIAVHVITRI